MPKKGEWGEGRGNGREGKRKFSFRLRLHIVCHSAKFFGDFIKPGKSKKVAVPSVDGLCCFLQSSEKVFLKVRYKIIQLEIVFSTFCQLPTRHNIYLSVFINTGCSSYSRYPDMDGVYADESLRSCVAQSGRPAFTSPSERAGELDSVTFKKILNLRTRQLFLR